MFECDFEDGEWKNPTVKPYQPLTLDPSASVFHYGQAVFEGMKAYKDEDDSIFLFRPEDNLDRINKSSVRLAIPEFPKELFFEGLESLLKIDKEWIKAGLGNSLYIRPFVISTSTTLAASPSNSYKFMIICSPVQAYYGGEVRVLISEDYSRSANGGFGYAKAAGNYGGQFYPTQLAIEKGFQQIIWTDSCSHEYIEEAGTMNIFFRVGDKLITAPTSDRILDGITRKSLLKLAESLNIECEVRPIKVEEIKDAARNGELKEIFGSGTAAVINPILGFSHKGEAFEIPIPEDAYSKTLKEHMLNIQYNLAEDKFGWRHEVK